jgi:hypothetical protein
MVFTLIKSEFAIKRTEIERNGGELDADGHFVRCRRPVSHTEKFNGRLGDFPARPIWRRGQIVDKVMEITFPLCRHSGDKN